ncbi:hypothetical protein SGRA_4122 [Saprospira grandis str. Lewin]|uniref:Uncharacterized protein n=1 Tax=Saprospira grandis (strain Lewin) TaxID=984262 RepID=H6L7G5_SAPGL|nr:hypothetical protein SGRA_4122 [Saprospira grandis str. Lewin]
MSWFFCFWGLRLPSVVGAAFRGSQVCSALRFFALLKKLGLAFGHPYTSLGRTSFFLALWQSASALFFKKRKSLVVTFGPKRD